MNVKEWLNDLSKRGALTDEERKLAESILTKPQVEREVHDAMERQSDYSRKMAELQEQKRLEDEYAARLAAWEGDVKEEVKTLKSQTHQYQQQIFAIAAKYNVDPQDLHASIQGAGQPPAQVTPKAVEPPVGGVTKEEVENSAAALFKLNAKMLGLNHEYMRLFGKPMENIDSFVDHALSKGVPIEQTFREFYKVADREAELNEAAVQARIAKAVEDAKMQWSTSNVNPMGIDPTRPKGTQSPIFENLEINSDKIPGTDAAHRARVQEVVAAFNQSQASGGNTP